uniref:Reverse transcriptase domain-containing protein n=1 Tax=Cajanus cajan TaxID=3821 RepID=A0A151QRE1_CAJCA|nr:hypothetical protein KK1_046343 [Cajanus cajan]
MASPCLFPTPSHAFYAGDILVFCRGNTTGLMVVMSLPTKYGDVSSQLINLEKCRFCSSSMPATRVAQIRAILEFSVDRVPLSYLCVPLFKGQDICMVCWILRQNLPLGRVHYFL